MERNFEDNPAVLSLHSKPVLYFRNIAFVPKCHRRRVRGGELRAEAPREILLRAPSSPRDFGLYLFFRKCTHTVYIYTDR